ncbi:hypothetical protein Tco_0547451 [Tanacetum coccineum]
MYQDIGFKTDMVALWNPAIKKSVGIVIPNEYTAIGFGVCPETSDPKVVKINTIDLLTVHWEVEVYSLSSRVWKSVSNGPAFKSCDLMLDQVTIDGFCCVWVMDDDGVTKSLTKMFTVKVPGKLLYSNVLGLRENGEVMIEMLEDSGEEYGIEVYEPFSATYQWYWD